MLAEGLSPDLTNSLTSANQAFCQNQSKLSRTCWERNSPPQRDAVIPARGRHHAIGRLPPDTKTPAELTRGIYNYNGMAASSDLSRNGRLVTTHARSCSPPRQGLSRRRRTGRPELDHTPRHSMSGKGRRR